MLAIRKLPRRPPAVCELDHAWRRTPAPVPAPVAVVEPVKLPTLDEVRSLRTNNQFDLYETGLKTLTQSADPQTKGRALALLALFYVDQKRTAEAEARDPRARYRRTGRGGRAKR